MSFEPPWKQPDENAFDDLYCPKCHRLSRINLIIGSVGRARWCKSCKLVFNRTGVLLDVVKDWEKQWLTKEEE